MQLLTSAQGWVLLTVFAVFFWGVSWIFSRKHDTQSREGFLLAGRSLGWVKSSFSIAATWIWAPALFIAAQQGYENGWVGVFWFTVPNVGCLMIFSVFAKKARKAYPRGFTLTAVTRERYSPRVQKVYLGAFLGLAVASTAVQLLAGGVVIAALTGIRFSFVVLALVGMALAYTAYSGLRASVVTDWIQMTVIGVVGLSLAGLVSWAAGGATLSRGLSGLDGLHSSLVSGAGASVFWSFGLATTIGLLSGPFGDQTFWQRAWAVRSKDVGKSFVVGGAVFALVPLSMSLLGFAAAGAGLEVADTQLVNLAAILHWLPEWTVIPFLLYIFSGLVSTLSSQMSAVSSLVGYDLAKTRPLLMARMSMVGLSGVAVAIALVPGIEIVQLFIIYGTLRACTLVPTIMMLTREGPLNEKATFYGILGSLAVAVPLSAVGNLQGITPLIVLGSLAAIGISGGASYWGAVQLRNDKRVNAPEG